MDRCRFSSAAVASLFLSAGWLLPVSGAGHGECSKGIDIAPGDDYSGWPDLFRLTDPYPTAPTASNRDEDAAPVDPSVLLSAGVFYKHFDPAGFDYPNRTKQIPWSPPVNGTNDEDLQVFREQKDYQYADIVVVRDYAEKYFTEHIHAAGDEVRYVIDGTGYFDIRDVNDEWVRMHARAGDFVEFPSGIEHRFAVDDNRYIQAMRLYPGDGEPDWSSVSRSEVHGNNTSRNEYVDKYLCGVDPDLEDHHDDPDDHHDDPDDHSDPDDHIDPDDDHSDHNHSHDDVTTSSFSSSLAVLSSATMFVVSAIVGMVLF